MCDKKQKPKHGDARDSEHGRERYVGFGEGWISEVEFNLRFGGSRFQASRE